MATLTEIRAKLQAAETKNTGNFVGDNAIYPHWNIREGENATLRFLPDSDTSNSFFWVERAMIRLPFNGIKDQPSDNKNPLVQVPCVEMWGDACPILAEVRTWFKDKGLEDLGRKYWKKRSYIFQGFVRTNPMDEETTPENSIRRFIMSPQLFTIIKAALMDTELEELPTDYVRGLDFRVQKTQKGGYADYTTSNWARKESAITAEEQAVIDQYGLFNLADFLPKKPSEQELKVMKEMFEASVDGRPYDVDRWSAYYRPAGMSATNANPKPVVTEASPEVVATASTTPITSVQEPVAETTAQAEEKPSGQKAEDILAMIRARQNNAS